MASHRMCSLTLSQDLDSSGNSAQTAATLAKLRETTSAPAFDSASHFGKGALQSHPDDEGARVAFVIGGTFELIFFVVTDNIDNGVRAQRFSLLLKRNQR